MGIFLTSQIISECSRIEVLNRNHSPQGIEILCFAIKIKILTIPSHPISLFRPQVVFITFCSFLLYQLSTPRMANCLVLLRLPVLNSSERNLRKTSSFFYLAKHEARNFSTYSSCGHRHRSGPLSIGIEIS